MPEFKIQHYDFNQQLFDEFQGQHYAQDLWPVVYVLSDGDVNEAYVGETTDALSRMSSHLKNDKKKKLSLVHFITSEKFNKSATLDIESNLIKYISGDGQYKLINANVGLANHNYYQKREVYWDMFTSIWDNLRAEGITKHSLEHIDNSDLFKYSPYKSLTEEQRVGLRTIMENLLDDNYNNVIVEGGAGTGKTILAIFLFKLLNSDLEDFNFGEFGEDELAFIELVQQLKKKYPNPKMGLVVPMSSFRNTLKQVFKNVKGLKSSMVIGPAEVSKNEYDIIVVDEAHRLRQRVNLGAYFGAFDKACERLGLNKHKSNELEWITRQAKNSIMFYDTAQSIKPSDVPQSAFDRVKEASNSKVQRLKSQFRVKGGNAYVEFIDQLLHNKLEKDQNPFQSKRYEFIMFDSIDELIKEIRSRDGEVGLSRLVAGYSWKWISKKDTSLFDIEIEGTKLRWNSTNQDWVNSENAVDEVGCIHTTQGYDLNYTGVIFGHEITYNKETDTIEIIEENYHDRNGKQSIKDPQQLKDFILNIYKTIMLRGIKGTYVYACDPDLRDYLSQFIPSANQEEESSIKILPLDKVKPFENAIPLYNLNAAAGAFSDVQQVEDVDWISLPEDIKYSKNLFAARVLGESMNRIIPNGSICLFRKYEGGSRNGQIVLVEHTDLQDPNTSGAYTVKEYRSQKNQKGGEWKHASITLHPVSTEEEYEPIQLSEDEVSGLKVIGIFERVLGAKI
jgi:DUF2075 family protein/predicted GIY-YIG superfamily endonuclease